MYSQAFDLIHVKMLTWALIIFSHSFAFDLIHVDRSYDINAQVNIFYAKITKIRIKQLSVTYQVFLPEQVSLAEHVPVPLAPDGCPHRLEVQLPLLGVFLSHLLLLSLIKLTRTNRPTL